MSLGSTSRRQLGREHLAIIAPPCFKMKRAPLAEEGTQIGGIGTSLIYIGYDERYYPRYFHLSGYQEDGVVWAATPYNNQDGEPESSIMIPVQPGKPMLWTP